MPTEGKTMPSMYYNCLGDNVTFYVREGDELPENGTCPIGGKTVAWPIREVFEGKRVLVVTIPGAFTPTCSTNQVPGFEEHYDEIKKAGNLDEIYIMAVNDSFVMNAWAKQMGIKKCKMLPDGNMSWTARLYLDTGMHEAGMGARCRRTALFFDDGTLKERWIENMATEEIPDPYQYSTPGNVLRKFGVDTDLDKLIPAQTPEDVAYLALQAEQEKLEAMEADEHGKGFTPDDIAAQQAVVDEARKALRAFVEAQ